MPTPAAVTKAAKHAEKLHADVYSEEAQAAMQLAGEKPELQVVKNTDSVSDEPKEPKEPKAEKKAEPPKPEAPRQPAAPEDVWEQKIASMRGRNEALQQQVQNLEAVLARLQVPDSEPGPDLQSMQRLITDSDVEDFGEDFIDVVRRAVKEATNPLEAQIKRLKSDNDRLRASLGEVSGSMTQSARRTVYTVLSERVPDWEAINKDSRFLSWLGKVDAFAGRKRRDMLGEAFEANDAARVVRFFEAFLNETASLEQGQPTDPPSPRAPAADLDSMVAPGRPRSSGQAGDAQGDKKMWSRQEIQQFYADVGKGKYRGRDKERNRIERDIFHAGNEGRITP